MIISWTASFIIDLFITLNILSLSSSSSLTSLFVFIIGSLHIPAVYNAPLYKPAGDSLEGRSLPCVVFSHGLGGNRLIYSTYCCELASRGCLVACVEHRYDYLHCHKP